MQQEMRKELFAQPSSAFKNHLEPPANHRILFSGRFGSGKTTFLRHYFEDSEHAGSYQVIHLYPVNYSVADNQDIFTYIKYDILVKLLNMEAITFDDQDSLDLSDVLDFAIKNAHTILSAAMLTIPGYGNQLSKTVDKVSALSQRIEGEGKPSAQNEVNTWQQEVLSREGGLYDYGLVTAIVQEGVRQLKKSGDKASEKEAVLIIDDLDRIDPAHIFRLLNVFSAHFDHRDDGSVHNKFGFDRIIFVCDEANLRSIYHHIYGRDTDYGGYIDKFYSHVIHRFDNSKDVLGLIQKVGEFSILRMKTDEQQDRPYGNRHVAIRQFMWLVSNLINQRLLNLRSLFRAVDDEVVTGLVEVSISGKRVASSATAVTAALAAINRLTGSWSITKSLLLELTRLDNLMYSHDKYVAAMTADLMLIADGRLGPFLENRQGQRDIELTTTKYTSEPVGTVTVTCTSTVLVDTSAQPIKIEKPVDWPLLLKDVVKAIEF